MQKKEILTHINKMYVFHKKWHVKLQKIQLGNPVPKSEIDFSITDCYFCNWYTNNQDSVFSEHFQKIGFYHKKVHHIFQTIKKKGLTEKQIDGTSYYSSIFETLKAKEQGMLLAYFKDLKKAHNQISKTIKELQLVILHSN